MPNVTLYNVAGQAAGEIKLNDSVFGVEYNEAVIHQAVVRQMANERLGTHATLTRGLVRGGGNLRGRNHKAMGGDDRNEGSTRPQHPRPRAASRQASDQDESEGSVV